MALDQRRSSSLPMTGEDTGLGALASPLAGYLGKVQERASSQEYCPWCTSKGLTYALRSYHINLQESITLCTNPQCLFPLVSRPLEDVLANLVPVEPAVGNKRKNAVALENEEVIKPSPKRLRPSEPDSPVAKNATDTHLSQGEPGAVNGQHKATKTDSGKVNGYHSDCPVAETAGWDSPQDEDVQEGKSEEAACTESLASPAASVGHLQLSSEASLTTEEEPACSPHHGTSEAEKDLRQMTSTPVENKLCCLDSNQSGFPNVDIHSTEMPSPQQNEQTHITTCTDILGVKSEYLYSTSITESEELVSVLGQPFWRNSDSLCWLDALLVALVNCKSLKTSTPKEEPQHSAVWQLIKGYEDALAVIEVHQQTGRDGVVKVPKHVLEKTHSDLQSLRMSLFKLLQPKLRCKLGQRETPVFAMPLLLTMDSWAEPLFQSTFDWEFKCSECKASTKERLTKTLPSLTNLVPDWHPLHAVHLAPCNVCRKKKQSRTLMLERLGVLFALHFVEGLPKNDISIYTFNFKGKRYSVTTVIQYNNQLKHFVTWICQSDGFWLEFDDLKHPDCKTHQKLPVPAREMHIVFWEEEGDKEPRACSPSSTFAKSPPSKYGMNRTESDLIADEHLACTPDQSLFISHNDTDIVCALSDDSSNVIDTTVIAGVDTSIGSTTLLDTFEGLTHNDIITLTLVELKADSEMQPLNDDEQTQDPCVPSTNEAPDSSSVVFASETSHSGDVDFPVTSNSSEPESDDGSSSDPTFVPSARRGQGTGKGKPVNKQKGKMSASTKAAPPVSPPVSSEASEENKPVDAAAQDNTPPVKKTQQVSPVSSTDTSTLSTSPTTQPSLGQNARWSFLLSKHPLNHVQKSIAKLAPTPPPTPTAVTKLKPTPPTHSTPNPVRRQQTPAVLFPKPQLRTEDSESLPLKAAEMYGAFRSKTSSTPTPLPSPTLLNGKAKLLQPITSDRQKPLTNTTAMSSVSLPALGVKRVVEISSTKKQKNHTLKLPPGLSETEILRYKLMKKLKAKKKKLAKLDALLGHQGGTSRPDSTDLTSPNTVSSSTYDGSNCDEILSDLLSPATTASNLSPDSTGYLEMLANGQDGVERPHCGVYTAVEVPQMNTITNAPNTENFLDEFLTRAEMQTEALDEFELFF
ncbi:SUMO-specific isopeptidase USPL1 [Scomber scombrus]|uniref:SUMO-specific isopeptidase USPL1 n=1 Tax=Scomber scombrus TaxID=13677 RepID=A0AAV1PB09_SCOSC